jgi:phage/plasmid-like protein (TIGR03299 family)
MSAEIDSIFYTGETPWHGIGTYLPEPVESQEAIIAGGLNWQVELNEVYSDILPKEPGLPLLKIKIPRCRSVIRTDKNIPLGTVGKNYYLLQNADAFKFADSLVKDGSLRYEVAGALGQGERVWLLGKLGSYDVVPNDKVDQYIFLYNVHDGSGSLRVLFTPIRVVCANTARAALQAGKEDGVRFRHTSNMMDKIKQAQDLLGISNEVYKEYRDFTKFIATVQLNNNKVEELVKEIIPNPVKQSKEEQAFGFVEEVSTRTKNKRNKVIELFESGIGQDLPGVAGTGWALYNAVTQYLNYEASVRGSNKANRRLEKILSPKQPEILERTVSLLKAV